MTDRANEDVAGASEPDVAPNEKGSTSMAVRPVREERPVWLTVLLAVLLVAATIAAYEKIWHAGFI